NFARVSEFIAWGLPPDCRRLSENRIERRLKYFCQAVLVVLFSVVLMGCGSGSGIQRMALSGTVKTADGEPINGSISFTPDRGTAGPVANGTITDGKYQFDKSTGP